MCLCANLLLLELRCACSRIQILVLAKYFGDFIPSPRNSPLCTTKSKNRPNGRFLKFWCEQRGSIPIFSFPRFSRLMIPSPCHFLLQFYRKLASHCVGIITASFSKCKDFYSVYLVRANYKKYSKNKIYTSHKIFLHAVLFTILKENSHESNQYRIQ